MPAPEQDIPTVRQEKVLNYINPSTRFSRVFHLMSESIFTPVVIPDGNEIAGIFWENQESDFQVIGRLQQFFNDTQELHDYEFVSRLDDVREIARESRLFQLLDEIPPEKRSKAHQDFSPFEHTINVLRLLDTSGLTPEQRAWARFYAMTHDLGKIVLAIADTHDDHSYISGLILREYFLLHKKLSYSEAIKKVQTIEYHHVQQAIDDGLLSYEQVVKLIDLEQIKFIAVLSLADGRSIEKYQQFALKNAQHSVGMLLEVVTAMGEAGPEFIKTFLHGLMQFAINRANDVKEVLEQFVEWIGQSEITKNFDEFSNMLFEKLKKVQATRNIQ